MLEFSKYKKVNNKLSVRLPDDIDTMLRKIAKKEDMSFNNVLVSCIQYALSNTDLSKYENVRLNEKDDNTKKELTFKEESNRHNPNKML